MNLKYALRYAAAGMRVHPLWQVDPATQRCACPKGTECPEKQRGKHPRLGGWQEKATTDEAQVREWWTRSPEAGIGIATGEASRVWVLDVDGPEAMAWYDANVEKHGLVSTLGVRTSRGAHLYWRWQDGVTVRNAQGLKAVGAPNVDVRGEGGYVCAPPTMHRSGQQYAWVMDQGFQREIAEPPAWLVEIVRERPKPPVPRLVIPGRRYTPQEARAAYRAAADTDPAVRERIGLARGGTLRDGSGRPYIDDLLCPRCVTREVWFYLDGGPAVCHHRNSCAWAGPITSI